MLARPRGTIRPSRHLGHGRLLVLLVVAVCGALVADAGAARTAAQSEAVPTPEEIIGFAPGEDYKLADYDQISAYFRALADASDRVLLRRFGVSSLGRPMLLAIISDPDNLARLDEYREIARELALGRIPEADARELAERGKAIVWIDSGLHATEVAHGQHAPVLAHWLATDESDEARRARRDAITLLIVNMNPDGLDIVVDWYRQVLGTPFETAPVPELYHHYIGHDNNRDWYMFTQVEHQAVARLLYHEWFPQLVYNQHQPAPFPARIWMSPVEDPINPNIDPGIITSLNMVGEAMKRRFSQEDKPGAISGVIFDGWWSGYMSDAVNYHNMVGFITETALGEGYATPECTEPDEIPDTFGSDSDSIPAKRPSTAYPQPWLGGCWGIGDAIDYMLTADRAVLDLASRLRGDWLFNIWRIGRRQIEKMQSAEEGGFAYVVDLERQEDPARALEMLRALRWGGIEIHRADEPFEALVAATFGPGDRAAAEEEGTAGSGEPGAGTPSTSTEPGTARASTGSTETQIADRQQEGDASTAAADAGEEEPEPTSFAAGTYVMPPQPFRPFLVDLMEPKPYPDMRQYPGGPPDPPYDMTGYELPLVMGVRVDRVDTPFAVPERAVERPDELDPVGGIEGSGEAAGGAYLLPAEANLTARAINRLADARARISWATEPFEDGGRSRSAGTVAVVGIERQRLEAILSEVGVRAEPASTDPTAADAPGAFVELRKPRIGLYRGFVSSMPEGWTRWLLEQHEFDFDNVDNATIRAGELSGYDAIVLPDQAASTIMHGHLEGTMPDEYVGGLGLEGALALRRWVEDGGWLIAVDHAVDFAIEQFGLPVRNVVAGTRPEEFFIPGSLINVEVDASEPAAFGLGDEAVAFFVNSQVLEIVPGAEAGDEKFERDLVSYVTFAEQDWLASGWALGAESHLAGKSAAIRAPLGEGQVVLLAFEPHFRAQSHDTFKLLFNPLFAATAGAPR